jgi:hypothetical protein
MVGDIGEIKSLNACPAFRIEWIRGHENSSLLLIFKTRNPTKGRVYVLWK